MLRPLSLARSLALLAAVSATLAWGQEALTNEGVINLVKSGMGEDLILNVIAKQPASFALGAGDLVALKNAGVSERLINAMVNKASGVSPTTGPGAGGTAAAPRASIAEPGLYYKKSNEYLELLSEQVEWKTGGAMKSIASAGIIKKDLKGSIPGPSSRNFLNNPVEIVISPPQGLTINDYILLPMQLAKGQREFLVGPVNKTNGVAKGAIPFGVEKVGANAFRMVFQTPLGPGEYGIFVPKFAGGASAASGSKMFTFRLLI